MSGSLAFLCVSLAGRILPPGREEWGVAMGAELEHVEEAPGALVFAFGCLGAALRLRVGHAPSIATAGLWAIALVTAALSLVQLGSAIRGVGIVLGAPDPYLQALLRGGAAQREVAAMYSFATPAIVFCLLGLGAAHAMSALFLVRRQGRLFVLAAGAALASCSLLGGIILWLGVGTGGIPMLFAALVLQSLAVPWIWHVLGQSSSIRGG